MPSKRTVVCFERACQEGVHLHIFDRVRMLKPPQNARYYKYFVLLLPDGQSAVHYNKAIKEQEVERDKPNDYRELPIT